MTKGWDGGLAQYLVDQGYIYFEIDNRGSANRGVAFEQPIYRAMGSVEVEDQKAAIRFTWTGTHRATFFGIQLTETGKVLSDFVRQLTQRRMV